MRTIPGSNGLELGEHGQPPWIDIIPILPGPALSIKRVEQALVEHDGTWAAGPVPSLNVQNAKGMMGMYAEAGFWIRLICAKGQSPMDALRAVDHAEGGLPPALAGTLYAAVRSALPKSGINLIAPRMLAVLTGLIDRRTAPAAMTSNACQVAAADLLFHGRDLPNSALDRAAIICVASNLLWKPGASRVNLEDYSAALALGQIAALRHLITPPLFSLQAGHAKIDIPLGSWNIVESWAQYLEWDAGQISQHTMNYLHAGQWPSGGPTVDRAWTEDQADQVSPTGDKANAMRIAYALIEDAERNAVYSVSGEFVVELPNSYPLRAWNVSALRVSADQEGLWTAVVDNDGKVGVSFRWQPRQLIRHYCVAEQATGILHATLAALWRDLQVAGEDALPRIGQSGAARSADRKPAQGPKRVTLPRRRQAKAISGRRQWGSDADRETIRRAHLVRGHLRQLASGWKASDAQAGVAEQHGIILPDGYTYVRPHTRGQGSAPVRETIIVARGLNTVMTLL